MNAYQVLLPRWLERPIKNRVKNLDVSISEILRIQVCISVMAFQRVLFPEYKFDIPLEEFLQSIKELTEKDDVKDEIREVYSDIYYETRKALDYREKKEKRAKKK